MRERARESVGSTLELERRKRCGGGGDGGAPWRVVAEHMRRAQLHQEFLGPLEAIIVIDEADRSDL